MIVMRNTLTHPLARHADAARATGDQLVRRWVSRGKFWMVPLLLSDYGHDLIYRKYDAIATDRAYENRPSGKFGVLGRGVDSIILRQDIHVGLRQRLAIVADEVTNAVRDTWAHGVPTVLLASGPCGLTRDLRLAWNALGAPSGRLTFLGLDLDSSGEVLPLASRLAAEVNMPLRTSTCDLLDQAQLSTHFADHQADIFLSIGLTVWLDPPDLAVLLSGLYQSITPGGMLIVDNFRAHRASRFALDLEMKTRYHAQDAFERALCDAGFVIIAMRETKNHVNCVYRCRKPTN